MEVKLIQIFFFNSGDPCSVKKAVFSTSSRAAKTAGSWFYFQGIAEQGQIKGGGEKGVQGWGVGAADLSPQGRCRAGPPPSNPQPCAPPPAPTPDSGSAVPAGSSGGMI